ncbi:MAG: beta-lactamase family protein [Firmicutes bacterium]|nr:beta-lactamase family protein [Bacillota bacterium]
MSERRSANFSPLIDHLERTQEALSASAASALLMREGRIVWEWYRGRHAHDRAARPVDQASQFNIASGRKAYLAFAVAYALFAGYIRSIDDWVKDYIRDGEEASLEGISIRHLLTHSHGLKDVHGCILAAHKPGTHWHYNNIGVNLLVKTVERATGKTVADILRDEVFQPLGFRETGWRTERDAHLIFNVHEETSVLGPHDRCDGTQSNLFTSTREFAAWGQLHLTRGLFQGRQVLSAAWFDEMTRTQSPRSLPHGAPDQGYLWWVQGATNLPMSELGSQVPRGAFQVLGYTGCACLVIPAYQTVAVRMFNHSGHGTDPRFQYLAEIRQFGDVVTEILQG